MVPINEDRIPLVTHFGTLTIGEKTADCGVLDDERRILFCAQIGPFLGDNSNSTSIQGELGFPAFMRREGVSKHLDPVLSDVSNQPFWVGIPQGFRGVDRAVAVRATVLPDICWGFVYAEMAGELHPSQRHIAERCREILEALLCVGNDRLGRRGYLH